MFYAIVFSAMLAGWCTYRHNLIKEGRKQERTRIERANERAQADRSERAERARNRARKRSSKPSRCKTGKCFADEFDRIFK